MLARGRHEGAPRSGLRWLAGAVGLAVAAGATVIAMTPAQASGATVDAQLSLSGVVTASSPIGGSVVGVHPGDTVRFSASTAPTAGLNALGLGNLVSGLLDTLAKYQVTVDFSHLPGGAASTTLSGSQTKSFTFPTAGTYNFTWSAQQVYLLGSVAQINLNGNELAAAGIKLNAANQYVGSVVVATNPPSGGISIQLPGVTLAPSLPVVGLLPTIAINPPVLPTIGVPSLPGLPGGSHTPGGSGSSSGSVNYTPPPTTIPELVVPKGYGVGGVSGNQNGSGSFGNPLPDLGGAIGTNAAPANGSSSSAAALVTGPRSSGPNQAELAANPAPSAQMPVLLAIIAIIALSLVTATYARLYLLRRSPA